MMGPLAILGLGHVGTGAPAELPKLELALLERTLRRGLSDTTRLFMHVAKLALDDAQVAPDEVQVLFASAFGEISVAEALLAEAYDANGSSPARFRNSVHNTSAGLFSISAKNRLPATALAAGWDTVAMALCEASAELALTKNKLLLVFAEERVPRALSADHGYGPLGVAFVLSGPTSRVPRAVLSPFWRGDVPPDGRFGEHDHPLHPALELARTVDAAHSRTVVLGLGHRALCVDVRVEGVA